MTRLLQPMWLCFLGFSMSCKPPAPQVKQSFSVEEKREVLPPPVTPKKSYAQTKTDLKKQKQALKTVFEAGKITMDSVRRHFTEKIVGEIFPHWYGTPWTFEGHTATPGQGSVACGYFVTTTLLDMGLPINRYKIAQLSPENEAAALSFGDSVQVFLGSGAGWMEPVLQSALPRNGLYFVGLGSSHVGFLLKKEGQFFAIHSNYVAPDDRVICQKLGESVFVSFDKIRVVNLTWNDLFLKKWLGG